MDASAERVAARGRPTSLLVMACAEIDIPSARRASGAGSA